MTFYGAIAVVVVAFHCLAALVLVLHHLKSLHLTQSQADVIDAAALERSAAHNTAIVALSKQIDDLGARLTQLGNRVRT